MFDFTDQIVLVTGGTGDLGAAVVAAFAGAGAHLVVPDRQSDRLAQTFPHLDGDSHFLASGYNIGVAEEVERLVRDALARYGRIDVLVNTVGGYRAGKPPHETALETWDFMLEVNARIPFLVSRTVVQAMLQQGRGKIVNTGSRSVFAGGADDVAYAAAKSALARLTESFSAAYRAKGINVNAVLPGTIDTPKNRTAMPKANFSRWVAPEAIAQVILFLASEVAAPIHGALIPVYGLS
jgi:NAD(P)-dependent dehydrogenase (short-subunit alcohol dehydrogenase family)